MEKSKLDKLSRFTEIARTRDLTEDEQKERAELRAEYIADVKANLRAQLDTIKRV